MFPRAVEDIPPLVTEHVLDAYAAYLIQNAASGNTDSTPADVAATGDTDGGVSGANVPRSLEEALAPLEVLFGKTALSAIGIALHGTETIVRYRQVSADTGGDGDMVHSDRAPNDTTAMHTSNELAEQRPLMDADAGARARCLYRVGEHTLLSPYYCPCSAYGFQSIRRGEVYLCKHLLALKIALRLEGTGIRQDNILVRDVDVVTFEGLILPGTR